MKLFTFDQVELLEAPRHQVTVQFLLDGKEVRRMTEEEAHRASEEWAQSEPQCTTGDCQVCLLLDALISLR